MSALGCRYRLHVAHLPGCPDIVLRSRKRIVFVHGCFWHQHNCKRGARRPKTNRAYWDSKLARNKERDRQTCAKLRRDGWRILVIWECQTTNIDRLTARLARLLAD